MKVAQAFTRLAMEGIEPKGIAYWNILDEGAISPRDRRESDRENGIQDSSIAQQIAHDDEEKWLKKGGAFYMAKAMNKYLRTRTFITEEL